MSILSNIWPACRTVSVIGMCKNAGKTVALDVIASEAADIGIRPGILSSGRDGEAIDEVTQKPKPAVHVKEGFHVVTLEKLLYSKRTTAELEIVETTDFTTPLGKAVVALVKREGTVEIAGPGSVNKIKHVVNSLHAYGAEFVLIDGSIDRKALSTPALSDGIVLATGAALSRRMDKVVSQTAHVVRLFSLPLAPEWLLAQGREMVDNKTSAIVTADGKWERLGIGTTLAGSTLLDRLMTKDTRALVLCGALTRRTLPKINGMNETRVVVQDPTRIFLDYEEMRLLEGRGCRFCVLYRAPVLTVTINPCSPDGFDFEPDGFLDTMKGALLPVPVLNVMRGS